ncbi:sensor histidine kinase [Desulfoferrobacter suflitae]|uniref:sensor histidine kinase n=1 Tax=Desulfoferrobacter suflitae TaxID=2865782 RepID=UPI0021646722|nr:HAMP domain-containing histidine kinase [Desulfoferrobacter suflitae]MCK8600263.1 HAMP domain-containing histidine kinase [Desulfoferrobacter suflitae]
MKHADNASGRRKRVDWYIAWGLIAVITVLHYSTMKTLVHFHTLYRDLYFIPILLVSFVYGLRTGFFTSIIIVLLYLPHVLMTWSAQPGVNFGNVTQIFVYVIVAVTMGYLSDREKARQAQIIESENWAALGRASLAMSYELEDVRRTLRNLLSSTAECNAARDGIQEVIERLATLEQAAARFAPDRAARAQPVVEVNEVVLKARDELIDLARKKEVGLVLDLKPTGCFIKMNTSNLQWVIMELTRNAIEHSRPGGVVTISSEHDSGRCTLEVKDRGAGISAENLQKIFVPFYTTKEKGTGLGLAACQKVMRDEGAEIEVESTPGEGSTFKLALPLAHTKSAADG